MLCINNVENNDNIYILQSIQCMRDYEYIFFFGKRETMSTCNDNLKLKSLNKMSRLIRS